MQVTFEANPYSPKLKFHKKDFYINIRGYGKNADWAAVIKETANQAAENILNHKSSEEVLRKITEGVKDANLITSNLSLRSHTGILRCARTGWEHGSEWDGYSLATPYGKSGNAKYKTYSDRFNKTIENPLTNPFPDIELTRPAKDKKTFLLHADDKFINAVFEHIDNIYTKLFQKYRAEDLKQKDLPHIMESIAEIRWILAHATPWERGSDSIANIFMRALFKSFGIKTFPAAKGISFDLEAFCTELKEYTKKFPEYFKKPPEIIE